MQNTSASPMGGEAEQSLQSLKKTCLEDLDANIKIILERQASLARQGNDELHNYCLVQASRIVYLEARNKELEEQRRDSELQEEERQMDAARQRAKRAELKHDVRILKARYAKVKCQNRTLMSEFRQLEDKLYRMRLVVDAVEREDQDGHNRIASSRTDCI